MSVKRNKSKIKQIRKDLKILNKGKCMLTGIVLDKSGENESLHHLEKWEYFHETKLEKSAVVLEKPHQWLEGLEHTNHTRYDLLNECLCLLNECLRKGNKDLIKQWEDEVQPLIKEKVYRR